MMANEKVMKRVGWIRGLNVMEELLQQAGSREVMIPLGNTEIRISNMCSY